MFGKNKITGQKYFNEAGDKVFITSVFMTLQGEGPFRGQPAVFVRLAKCNLACSFCFVPSTNILMSDGSQKKIKDIVVGDMVMSWSGDKFEPKPVVKTYINVASELVKVEIDSIGDTWCTPEHPFLVSGKGWIEAKDLNQGDKIVHFSSSERMKIFNPMFDSDNHREMTIEQKKTASIRLSNLWKDKEFREKNIQRLKDHNPMKDPEVTLKSFMNRENQVKSKLEEKIEKICDGLPIQFVGNGDLIISYKVPDFVVNGQKKVIEVWPSDALWIKNKPRDIKWMKKRAEIFAKKGYDVLFLPLTQSELKIDNHKNIREKVAQFINNGNVVKKVSKITDGRSFARLYGSKTAERIVHNIEVADHHTYVANNLVVHNCDTWFDSGDWLTLDELRIKIYHAIKTAYKETYIPPAWLVTQHHETFEFSPPYHCGLVITGGEPMLQKNLTNMLQYFDNMFDWIQIESNGTLLQDLTSKTTLVCSPKCSEKEGKPVKYLKPREDVLERANCLKFVMSADQNSPYYEVPEWGLDWSRKTGKPIFVSPMNIYNKEPERAKSKDATRNSVTIEERSVKDEVISFWSEGLLDMRKNQLNHEYAAKYCLQHGCIFNLQIHLFASLA